MPKRGIKVVNNLRAFYQVMRDTKFSLSELNKVVHKHIKALPLSANPHVT